IIPMIPPAPMSESAIQAAVRRGMLPWLLSAIVLVFGAVALVWGFLLVNRQSQPAPVPVPVVAKDPAPAPTPAPAPAPAPVAEAVVDAGAAPVAVDSALVSVSATVPARVSVDGAAAAKVPIEL